MADAPISHYSFGRIIIGGGTYTSDVIIFPDRVNSHWRRQQGHLLTPGDLAEVVGAAPGLLIIGTGNSGLMKVPAETVAFLKAQGIEVEILPTAAAADAYNRAYSEGEAMVVGAFHLTC